MAMSWLKIPNNLPEDPRSFMLEETLGEKGWPYVVQVWMWLSRVRETGSIEKLSDAMIAHQAGWRGDASLFVGALRTSGFLEETTFADWEALTGEYRAKKERNAARYAKDAKEAPAVNGTQIIVQDSAAPEPPRSEEIRRDQKRGEERREKNARTHGRSFSAYGRGSVVASNAESVGPTTVEELLAEPCNGSTLRAVWGAKFQALDGQAGRPSIDDAIAETFDYWLHRQEKEQGKRWAWPLELRHKLSERLFDANLKAKRDLRADQIAAEQRARFGSQANVATTVVPRPDPEEARERAARVKLSRDFEITCNEARDRGVSWYKTSAEWDAAGRPHVPYRPMSSVEQGPVTPRGKGFRHRLTEEELAAQDRETEAAMRMLGIGLGA